MMKYRFYKTILHYCGDVVSAKTQKSAMVKLFKTFHAVINGILCLIAVTVHPVKFLMKGGGECSDTKI